MTDAFVLINTAMGHEAEVLAELRDIEGISMVHGTFGAYDVIVKVENNIIVKGKSISVLAENEFNQKEFDTYIRPLLKYIKPKESFDTYTDKLYENFYDKVIKKI